MNDIRETKEDLMLNRELLSRAIDEYNYELKLSYLPQPTHMPNIIILSYPFMDGLRITMLIGYEDTHEIMMDV